MNIHLSYFVFGNELKNNIQALIKYFLYFIIKLVTHFLLIKIDLYIIIFDIYYICHMKIKLISLN